MQSAIQPRVVGPTLDLSDTSAPVVFRGWVLGAPGALPAVPLTLLAKAVPVDSDPRARWIGSLLSAPGSKPAPTDEDPRRTHT